MRPRPCPRLAPPPPPHLNRRYRRSTPARRSWWQQKTRPYSTTTQQVSGPTRRGGAGVAAAKPSSAADTAAATAGRMGEPQGGVRSSSGSFSVPARLNWMACSGRVQGGAGARARGRRAWSGLGGGGTLGSRQLAHACKPETLGGHPPRLPPARSPAAWHRCCRSPAPPCVSPGCRCTTARPAAGGGTAGKQCGGSSSGCSCWSASARAEPVGSQEQLHHDSCGMAAAARLPPTAGRACARGQARACRGTVESRRRAWREGCTLCTSSPPPVTITRWAAVQKKPARRGSETHG